MRITLPLLVLPLFFVLGSCNSCSKEKKEDNKYALKQPLKQLAAYDEGYPITTEEVDENAPYQVEEFKKYYSDYYKDKSPVPAFDFSMDISQKSFNELRMLRAEIMARHGFLFMDYVSRSHFNATKWYQPVFWYDDFKIRLSDEEQQFIDRVLVRESELYKQQYVKGVDGKVRVNMANVVNWEQFDPIPASMKKHLADDGFVINAGRYEQLFHVYDENYYDYTPSFITTDLYLQVLHMHISKELQAIEMDKFIPLVTNLLMDQHQRTEEIFNKSADGLAKKAAGWNLVYYAVSLSLLNGGKVAVPADLAADFETEYTKAEKAEGRKSDFLGDSLMDYTQFQPRGNYTRNDSLKRYFKCVKWLNSASIFLDEDERLASAILMGWNLLRSESATRQYQQFTSVISFLSGEENNLSFLHMMEAVKGDKNKELTDLLSAANMNRIRENIYARDPKKFVKRGANDRTNEFLERKKLVFTAGRYTFDGEILQRLVHVTKPTPKRPFPKGLDVFAAMSNATAETILTDVYHEKEKWSGYGDTLNLLKQKFRSFDQWNTSIYNKTMESVLSLQKPQKNQPYYMNLPNWQKKNLNTMLAGWTGLKHDMVLYIDQPSGAEMGDGGEVPPPQKIAYVEPQVDFWTKCRELLVLNQKMLDENELKTEALLYRNKELDRLAGLLQRVSVKELAGEKLSNRDFDSLVYIGGEVEQLTLQIIESDQTVTSMVSTPERYVAIATDVYTYNANCLEEAVGFADEIYVVAEINGLLYLTRGAVFSQFEFTRPTTKRLTDEEWQKEILEDKIPPIPVWMRDIKVEVPKVKTAPNYNLY